MIITIRKNIIFIIMRKIIYFNCTQQVVVYLAGVITHCRFTNVKLFFENESFNHIKISTFRFDGMILKPVKYTACYALADLSTRMTCQTLLTY